jgi:BMFP domain-containing protein YqiC
MTERPKFFDDLAGVAGGAMSAFAGLREELTAAARARVDEAVRKMDLVKREDFEAMAELARRARDHAEALELRVAALEGHIAATRPAPEPSDVPEAPVALDPPPAEEPPPSAL